MPHSRVMGTQSGATEAATKPLQGTTEQGPLADETKQICPEKIVPGRRAARNRARSVFDAEEDGRQATCWPCRPPPPLANTMVNAAATPHTAITTITLRIATKYPFLQGRTG